MQILEISGKGLLNDLCQLCRKKDSDKTENKNKVICSRVVPPNQNALVYRAEMFNLNHTDVKLHLLSTSWESRWNCGADAT